MKLIIDIPEEVVKAIQNGKDYRYDIHTAIAQGIPYEERPSGEWIRKVDDVGFVSYVCNKCGFKLELEDCSDSYYYTNCGAKMKEADND